ncbi:MAG: alpha-L-rhamnosidase N-terminal domain-containing protein, partial [Eubacteriales bacterium]
MKIYDLRINRSENTLGISPENILFSFKADTDCVYKARIVSENGDTVAQKNVTLADACGFRFDISLAAGEIFFFETEAAGHTERLMFETAASLGAPFITPSEDIFAPEIKKSFHISGKIKRARLYITGLGLYRAKINGMRAGE